MIESLCDLLCLSVYCFVFSVFSILCCVYGLIYDFFVFVVKFASSVLHLDHNFCTPVWDKMLIYTAAKSGRNRMSVSVSIVPLQC